MQKIMIGADIVYLPRIERFLQNESAVQKVFHPAEIKDFRTEHLGGIFAAKEAFFKAVGKRPKWLDIEIIKNKNGKPKLNLISTYNINAEVSISHDGDYAIATVVATKC